MKTPNIVFGPYVVRQSEPQTIGQHVEDTGCSLEFATAEELPRLRIFRHMEYQEPYFTCYVIREASLPFEITTWGFQVKHFAGGPYITLSAYLAGIYKRFDRLRPIQDFLFDFRELLPVEGLWGLASEAEYPLKPWATSAGYRVAHVMPHGRRLTVEIVWLFPQDRNAEASNSYLDAAVIEFRPKHDHTLGLGKWGGHRECFVENLLFENLQNIARNNPSSFFEKAATSRMLKEFDWTPLALMTNSQARQARVEFVKKHRHLIEDPKAMAVALTRAGLYGPKTTPHQICKFLPSLISAAAPK